MIMNEEANLMGKWIDKKWALLKSSVIRYKIFGDKFDKTFAFDFHKFVVFDDFRLKSYDCSFDVDGEIY